MRFCLDKYLNIQHQTYILNTICEFLADTCENTYFRSLHFIQFTFTKRRHLGKIILHRFRDCKISNEKHHSIKKLTKSDWTREFNAEFYFGVIRPLSTIIRLTDKTRNTILKKLREQFLSWSTVNFVLRGGDYSMTTYLLSS